MKHKYYLPMLAVVAVVGLGSVGAYVSAQHGETQQAQTFVTEWDSKTLTTYSRDNTTYSFKHPDTWRVNEIPSMSYVRVENIDARTLDTLSRDVRDQYFKIEVVTLPRNGLSLNDWVEKQNTTSYPLPTVLEQKNIEVAGQPAIYQVEQFDSFVHPAVFVEKGDNVYIINISSNEGKYRTTVEEFIKGFSFNS